MNMKLCKRKNIQYWLCKPLPTTIVWNRFEHPEISREFSNKDYLTAEEMYYIRLNSPNVYEQIIAHCIDGSMWCIGDNGNNFIVADGSDSLNAVSTEFVMENFVTSNGKEINIKEVKDWVGIKLRNPEKEFFAEYDVVTNKFVVAPSIQGKPNMLFATYIAPEIFTNNFNLNTMREFSKFARKDKVTKSEVARREVSKQTNLTFDQIFNSVYASITNATTVHTIENINETRIIYVDNAKIMLEPTKTGSKLQCRIDETKKNGKKYLFSTSFKSEAEESKVSEWVLKTLSNIQKQYVDNQW